MKTSYKDQNKIFIKVLSYGYGSKMNGVLYVGFRNATALREWLQQTYLSLPNIPKSATVAQLVKFYQSGYSARHSATHGATETHFFTLLTRQQYLSETHKSPSKEA